MDREDSKGGGLLEAFELDRVSKSTRLSSNPSANLERDPSGNSRLESKKKESNHYEVPITPTNRSTSRFNNRGEGSSVFSSIKSSSTSTFADPSCFPKLSPFAREFKMETKLETVESIIKDRSSTSSNPSRTPISNSRSLVNQLPLSPPVTPSPVKLKKGNENLAVYPPLCDPPQTPPSSLSPRQQLLFLRSNVGYNTFWNSRGQSPISNAPSPNSFIETTESSGIKPARVLELRTSDRNSREIQASNRPGLKPSRSPSKAFKSPSSKIKPFFSPESKFKRKETERILLPPVKPQLIDSSTFLPFQAKLQNEVKIQGPRFVYVNTSGTRMNGNPSRKEARKQLEDDKRAAKKES